MTIESQDDINPKYCTDRTNQTLYLVDKIEKLSMPRCDIDGLKSQIEQLKKENNKLKELLKECREWIYDDMSEDFEEGRMEFLTKIDNAIGEKK